MQYSTSVFWPPAYSCCMAPIYYKIRTHTSVVSYHISSVTLNSFRPHFTCAFVGTSSFFYFILLVILPLASTLSSSCHEKNLSPWRLRSRGSWLGPHVCAHMQISFHPFRKEHPWKCRWIPVWILCCPQDLHSVHESTYKNNKKEAYFSKVLAKYNTRENA